jgi:putative transposase
VRVLVHPADLREADTAPWLLATAYAACDRLRHIWAAMADRGQPLRAWVEEACSWTLESVERPRRWGWYPIDVEPPPLPAFTVLPRRWVVERTIAWIGRYRRLSKDYEYLPETAKP